MRRKDKEIVDQDIILEILKSGQICRIALSGDEFPYIIPLYFGYESNQLFFHTARQGKKIDLIRKNNRACFEIEFSQEVVKHAEPCQWTSRYRSVIGYGNISFIEDPLEKKSGMDIIMKHYGSLHNSFNDKLLDSIAVLRLEIKEITGKQSGDWL